MNMSGAIQEAEGVATVRESQPFAFTSRRLAWAVFAGLSAMFLLSMVWRPADESAVILCPFRSLTGLLCPGCGMTRAFCALGHGELLRAIHFNALSPLLYLSFIIIWVGAGATLLNLTVVRDAVMRLRPSSSFSGGILVLVFVWWVARLIGGF